METPVVPSRSTDQEDPFALQSRQHRREGIVVAPWLVTLVISLGIQLLGAAYITGTVISRIEAMASNIVRLEKQIDVRDGLIAALSSRLDRLETQLSERRR